MSPPNLRLPTTSTSAINALSATAPDLTTVSSTSAFVFFSLDSVLGHLLKINLFFLYLSFSLMSHNPSSAFKPPSVATSDSTSTTTASPRFTLLNSKVVPQSQVHPFSESTISTDPLFWPRALSSASKCRFTDLFKTQSRKLTPGVRLFRAIAADMERVYEIGPVFRAENSNTHRHLTGEFFFTHS